MTVKSVRAANAADPAPGVEGSGQCVTYGPTGTPDVMVLVEHAGQHIWCPGRLHLQYQREHVGWVFVVEYVVAGQPMTDTFRAERVRGEVITRFFGRG